MMSRVKLTILLLSTLIVAYGLIGGIMDRVSARDDAYPDLSIFTEVLSKVQKDYVERPDMDKAVQGAIHGMLEALDPYSSFVEAAVYRELGNREDDRGSTGLLLSKRYGYAYVVSVVPGSPADRAGIRSGDMIESIEGQVTSRMSLWQAQQLMAGPPGSRVQIRLIRARRTELSKLDLAREELAYPLVSTRILEDGIAILQIPHFRPGVAEAVLSKLKMLRSSGIRGLLVDLRQTAEGEVETAVQASDYFLPKGAKIATVQDREGKEVVHLSRQDPVLEGLPVILLIGSGTSGVGEIFAAALFDNQVARTVGERTDGRGSLQEKFGLGDGSMLFISTRIFFRPSGDPIQAQDIRDSGLKPDVRSPSPDFVSNFYFEHSSGDSHESLGEEFYRKLDAAVEQEQFETGLKQIRILIDEKAA